MQTQRIEIKKYVYFISYVYSHNNINTIQNREYESDKLINSIEDIRKIEIDISNNGININIINYQLLREEKLYIQGVLYETKREEYNNTIS